MTAPKAKTPKLTPRQAASAVRHLCEEIDSLRVALGREKARAISRAKNKAENMRRKVFILEDEIGDLRRLLEKEKAKYAQVEADISVEKESIIQEFLAGQGKRTCRVYAGCSEIISLREIACKACLEQMKDEEKDR